MHSKSINGFSVKMNEPEIHCIIFNVSCLNFISNPLFIVQIMHDVDKCLVFLWNTCVFGWQMFIAVNVTLSHGIWSKWLVGNRRHKASTLHSADLIPYRLCCIQRGSHYVGDAILENVYFVVFFVGFYTWPIFFTVHFLFSSSGAALFAAYLL